MHPTDFITLKEVAVSTGLARSTIYQKMAQGNFPKPIKISTHAVRWRRGDVENWKNSFSEAV